MYVHVCMCMFIYMYVCVYKFKSHCISYNFGNNGIMGEKNTES